MTKVYSIDSVTLSINTRRITGLPRIENAIEYTPKVADWVTTQESMDNSGSFNYNPNRGGILTFKLIASHDDNDYMAAYLEALKLGSVAPPLLVHLVHNGGDYVVNGLFQVQGPSTGGMGIIAENRTWTLVSPSVDYNPGVIGHK